MLDHCSSSSFFAAIDVITRATLIKYQVRTKSSCNFCPLLPKVGTCSVASFMHQQMLCGSLRPRDRMSVII